MPTCPGWVARDLVDHVGEVYAHERAVLRLGRRPVEGEWPWAPDDDTVFEWFDVQLAGLLEELDRREPTEPAWTFYTADQTVGFWWRKMAHETAIHRVDAELAAGTAVAPHEDSQAIDGVAELLALAGDPAALADPGASLGSSGSVLVSAGASTVLVSMQDGEQFVEASSGPADAVVLVPPPTSTARCGTGRGLSNDRVIRWCCNGLTPASPLA